MIPCLYEANEKSFTTNGIGKLSDAVSCYVTEERNNSYELEMEYPADGIHAEDLVEGRIILAKPNLTSQTQPFRIYKILTPLTGLLEVYARHISYQLNYITVSKASGQGCKAALQSLKSAATTNCDFTFTTDIQSTLKFNISTPNSMRNCLGGVEGSILDTFGCEFEWDRWKVIVHAKRGADNGVRIVYGKNLIDFKMEKNIGEVITGIHPYWKDSETGDLVELPQKVLQAENVSTDYYKVMVLDCSSEFESKPTVAQLQTYAQAYLKSTDLTSPDIDIDIDFAQLSQMPGYENIAAAEKVSLCDTVTVYIPKLGLDVSSKVTETTYDVLLERYKSITLSNSTIGAKKNSLAGSIAGIYRNTEDLYNRLSDYATVSEMSTKIEMEEQKILLDISGTYATNSKVEETLKSAEGYTDTKLKSYSTTDEMNSAIKLATDNITLEVSKKYATEQSVLDAITKSEGYTDTQLKSYSTTDQMNSAIKLASDNLSLEVSKKYATVDSVTTAVSTAEGYTDSKLKSYSTTTEMNSAIKLATDNLTLEVSKKYATVDSVTKGIATAEGYTDTKLKSYSTTTDMNSAIKLATDNLTLEVSKKYATVDSVTSAISTAEGYTDTKLKSYSTTTDMNAAIKLATDNITLSVSKTYATQESVTTAIQTTEGYTDSQLTNYSNTTEMNTAISLATGQLMLQVEDMIDNELYDLIQSNFSSGKLPSGWSQCSGSSGKYSFVTNDKTLGPYLQITKSTADANYPGITIPMTGLESGKSYVLRFKAMTTSGNESKAIVRYTVLGSTASTTAGKLTSTDWTTIEKEFTYSGTGNISIMAQVNGAPILLTDVEVLGSFYSYVSSQITMLKNSITLSVTGSLGNTASIVISAGDNKSSGKIDLSNVKKALANDKTAVTITAGAITFNSNTIVINSKNASLTAGGALTASGATLSGKITSINGDYETQINNGYIQIYYQNVLYGRLTPIYKSGDPKYYSLLGNPDNCGAISLGIGTTGYIFVNNTANPNGYSERIQIAGSTRFTGSVAYNCSLTIANGTAIKWLDKSKSAVSLIGMSANAFAIGNNSYNTTINGKSVSLPSTVADSLKVTGDLLEGGIIYFSKAVRIGLGKYNGSGAVWNNGNLYASGEMGCGGTKYRIVKTEHYGNVGMSAYETASSQFGDFGSGTIGEDGQVSIFFDPEFTEVIDMDGGYQVLLTPTSAGAVSYAEKMDGYFIVHGDPGATFDWMISAHQQGYTMNRMEQITLESDEKVEFDDYDEVFSGDNAAEEILEDCREEAGESELLEGVTLGDDSEAEALSALEDMYQIYNREVEML